MNDPTRATRRSLLIRLAWRQSLVRMLLVYALALAAGWWTQQYAWCLLAATAGIAARSYWRLFRVARFLDWRKQLRTVHGQGLWAALETLNPTAQEPAPWPSTT